MNWSPIILSLELAAISTVLLLIIAVPLAYWLARTSHPLKPVVQSIVSLPIVLPPTVIGFYLLVALSPNNAFGNWLQESLGLSLVFTFEGLILASIIYSLPFMVQPIQAGLASLPPSLGEASALLGKSSWQTLWHVYLPNIRPALLSGVILAFAHTIGEFGVVLMIGGNIPDKTRVASIAIYDAVESLDYASAGFYSMVLLLLCFLILLTVNIINRKTRLL